MFFSLCKVAAAAMGLAAVQPVDISKVLPEPSSSLKELPNVIHKMLKPQIFPKPVELPKSVLGLPKAAIFTFQTWMGREPKAVGMLFGPPFPDEKPKAAKASKVDATCLVVGTGLGALWNHQSTKKLVNFFKYVPLGVVVGGELMDGGDLDGDLAFVRKAWCSMMISDGFDQNCFVLVSFSQFGILCSFFEIVYVYRYIYIYLYLCISVGVKLLSS